MANVYNRGKFVMSSGGSVDWAGATDVRSLIVTSAYTYDADHNFVSQITNELAGGGYGRQQVLVRTKTEDDVNDRIVFDADNTTFPTLALAAGQPFATVEFNQAGGADAARELICYNLLTAPNIPNGGDYTIAWAATGVLRLDDT